jgi:glutathione S-transferase
MKLYDTPGAPNPRRVRWFMAEKGIGDVEVVTLNILKGAHKTPEYLDLAGVPQVPALALDDGTVITESLAICRYLESRYPEPNLFGRTPEEAAVIEMWTRRAEMMLANPVMLAVRHTHPALAVLESQVPGVAEYNREQGLANLPLFDRRLGEVEWLAGERFTIADLIAFVGLDFGRMIKLQIPEGLSNLARWMDAMRARPASAGI